jgi:ABC-type transport system involved in cytochrome c biogenesis ATPase subunit
MISRIEAFRYRCFDHLDIGVGPFHVLAGTNGSGKSTLLDIPILLGDVLKRGVTAAFLEDASPMGGGARTQRLRDLIHCYRGDFFGFAVQAALPKNVVTTLVERLTPKMQVNESTWPSSVRYEIRFQIFNEVELNITDEFLYLVPQSTREPEVGWGIGGKRPPRWRSVIRREIGGPAKVKAEYEKGQFSLRLEPQRLALANVPMDSHLFPAAVYFRELLERELMRYDPNWAGLRTACPPGQPKRIRADAANLPWLVLWLKRSNRKRFQRWAQHIKQALPNVTSIDAIEREEDHHAYLKVDYHGGYSVTSSGLSDGTLRILALTILPYLEYAPRVICLEEPENGIHPRAIQRVLESLTSMYDSQLWLSTHSPIVLANTELKHVIVMHSDETGTVRAIPGNDHPRLQEWQGGIDLGSLYAAGVLA